MQKENSRSRFTPILLVMYGLFFIWWMYFAPKPTPAPPQAQSILTSAQQTEAEGRDPQHARGERIEKLKKAIGLYEQFYQADKKGPRAGLACFAQINLYDYLANLEGAASGTHWYDQAEARLKTMEKELLHRTGSVELEVNGQKTRRTGDLGAIASERLNTIRAARDVRNRGKWTYRGLDILVRVTGSQPAFSYLFALTLIVVVLKVLTFPFQKKQYQYQKDMMRVQPLLKEVQEKMKGRPPEEVNRRVMQVYKENNVNIAGGCLPMLVPALVLFPVFWMVRDYEYQFTRATFLWIGTEYSRGAWWLADNLAQFDVPLFLLYNASTVLYSLMQPKPADPQQAQTQKMMMVMMPVVFGIFMWSGQWSSAFMLYWLVLNIVSMWQTRILMKEYGLGGGGGDGGSPTPTTPALPDEPLKPMKGVQTGSRKNGSGRGGRRRPGSIPGRVQPHRSDGGR